jgi:hypothetical protein
MTRVSRSENVLFESTHFVRGAQVPCIRISLQTGFGTLAPSRRSERTARERGTSQVLSNQ